jgi:hypothetical protein
MSDSVAPMVVGVSFFLIIGWIVRMLTTNRRLTRVAQAQLELQGKLLDRFGSAQELATYLGTEAGRRLLDLSAVERAAPHARILGAIQAGIVLSFGGVAFLVMSGTIAGAMEGFMFIGTLGLCLGLAFLASAGVAWTLSRRWGLIADRDRSGEPGA